MNLMKDPRPLEPDSYWATEAEGPDCPECGEPLISGREQLRGICDACWEAANEEGEP